MKPGPTRDWSVRCNGLRVVGDNAFVILSDLTFDLSSSGISAIMGPNGAGKSVLMKTIAGLRAPVAGAVELNAALSGRTAMVFQNPVLLRRTVEANIAHALSVRGVNRGERRDRTRALLEQGRLVELARRPARSLSGGEQQRLQIIRALALDPRLMLLDEPTASLDPHSTQAIESLLLACLATGIKIVLVTHDIGQARRLADEILFLDRGRLAELGPKTRLDQPESVELEKFLNGQLVI